MWHGTVFSGRYASGPKIRIPLQVVITGAAVQLALWRSEVSNGQVKEFPKVRLSETEKPKLAKSANPFISLYLVGGGRDRTRTCDLLRVKQAL